jgi:hypothetical protein
MEYIFHEATTLELEQSGKKDKQSYHSFLCRAFLIKIFLVNMAEAIRILSPLIKVLGLSSHQYSVKEAVAVETKLGQITPCFKAKAHFKDNSQEFDLILLALMESMAVSQMMNTI